MNDKVIEFETMLYKLKQALERLKSIGFDTTIYEDIIKKVVKY